MLVVDDDEASRRLVEIALRRLDVEVVATGDPHQVIGLVLDLHPAVIVLDVMMPGLDGFEVAKRLGERRNEAPIIFLTARDTTDDKIRGLTIGGDDYVTKPFSIEELVARIRAMASAIPSMATAMRKALAWISRANPSSSSICPSGPVHSVKPSE